MLKIDKSKPVMITGATGYLAGQIIKILLNEGLTVHGTVRDPNKKEKLKYLNELAQNSPGSIKYFKADLLNKDAFLEPMKGCQVVFHTASPFVLDVEDPQRDLVDPAVHGTANVLNTANQVESVKRIVVTSSCASIYGDNKDIQSYPNKIMTEDNWNTTSSLEHGAYSFSKVQAERKAWEISKEQNRWDLVTVNPSFIMGPGINPNGTSESFNFMKQYGDGSMKMGAPRIGMGYVDVRDVAEVHVRAAFTPDAKGRYIASSESLDFVKVAGFLREKFGDKYPFPKRALPKWLLYLVGPSNGLSRQYVRNNVNYECRADNSKSINDLGMKYRPVKETVTEFFQQMIDHGVFNK